MIDKCIRWGMAVIIPNRETTTILNAIATGWFRLFGPPKKMSSDKEGAIVSDAGALRADGESSSIRALSQRMQE